MPYSVDLMIDLITASTPDERAVGIRGGSGQAGPYAAAAQAWEDLIRGARPEELGVWSYTTIVQRDDLSSINVR